MAAASLEWNLKHDNLHGFVKRFQPLYLKMSINTKKIEKSKEFVENKQKDDNKTNFIIFAAIAIAVSYFISVKFSS